MRNDFIYFNTDLVHNMVLSKGITSNDFIQGVYNLPDNILLINNDSRYSNEWNDHTRFNLIKGQPTVLKYLLDKQVRPKKWIDFQNDEDLDTLLGSEIAEILYLNHMEVPLRRPFSSKLQNRYIFLMLKNQLTKIYYRQFLDFNRVLDHSIIRHMKDVYGSHRVFSRSLSIKSIPNHIMKILIPMGNDGLIIGFNQVVEKSHHDYHVPLLIENNLTLQSDNDSVNEFYRNSKIIGELIYQTTTSQWNLQINDKNALNQINELI